MRQHVAFDIETTGLTASSETLIIGTHNGDRTLIQAQPTDVFQGLDPASNENVSVRTYDDEHALLENGLETMVEHWGLADDTIDRPVLVGFNSELQYGGTGFDVPFLRTRCATHELPWALDDVEHIDLKESVPDSFLTKQPDPSGLNKRPLREFGEYVGAEVDGDMYKSELSDAVADEAPDIAELEAFATEHDHDLPTKSRRSLDGLVDLLCDVPVHSELEGADFPEIMAKHASDDDEQVTAHEATEMLEHNLDDLRSTYALCMRQRTYGSLGQPVHL